jgi:outer membrane protein OmpA-like peptidoglycan-associated protein
MTKLFLPLGGAALLLALGGCATQQAGLDPADPLNQRLGAIEGAANLARDQGLASQSLIGDLARKIDALSGEVGRLREAGAGQDARQRALADQLARDGRDAGQRARESAALAERLGGTEQRLDELAAQARENAARTADLRDALPGLRDKAAESAAPLADRLGRAEQRLDELAARNREHLAQTAGLQASLPTLADRAAAAAVRADDLAARLARIEKRLEEVAAMAQDALDATGLGQRRILGKVMHTVTLTDDKTLFPINSPVLGDKDMAKLDELAARVKAMGTYYHLQIQGHTDGFGSEDYNYDLGRARAEVVKNYLNEKGGIPLLRMSVISYGASEAANYTGKSNRRIVVHVLQ